MREEKTGDVQHPVTETHLLGLRFELFFLPML